ncbi:MAG: helix-turn-helix transcriptional regulator [Bdellovibrionales bacterium]|nr:helix-turn-helix transcriptional regulator [Bdellovibrionales bacterium]
MTQLGTRYSKIDGSPLMSRAKIARNFRQLLLHYHALWDPSFEIVFWRKGNEVICEVQNSDTPLDRERVAQLRQRAHELQMDPARLIRSKRKVLGLSITRAAQQAGMARSYWNMIERGQRRLSLVAAQKIGQVLDLPSTELLGLS